MHETLQQVRDREERARSFRKKGDAMRKAGRETDAREAYEAGVTQLLESQELLQDLRQQLKTMSPPLSNDMAKALSEIVEVSGALGGLYQRLGSLDKALESYTAGSVFEDQFKLPGTYNRLNEVKYQLLTGEKRLGELIPRIQRLAALIDSNIRSDETLGDSGWALADLADCLALLGRTEEAERTYAKFVEKAELKSPERTFDVLKEIASRLSSSADPEAPRVQAAIGVLQAHLVRR